MTRQLGTLGATQRRRLQIEAVRLREAGLDYARIGSRLDVTAIGARDLCMQHRRLAKQYSKFRAVRPLPPRMIALFLNGRYADVVASARSVRVLCLAEIASHYSRNELLMQPRIGRAMLDRVERWLAAQGRCLRASAEPMSDDVGGRRNHREWSVRVDPAQDRPATAR